MIYTITKKINCDNIKYSECSDNIIKKLSSLNLKLVANNETDTVNGYLHIIHGKPHQIKIELYEKDDKPDPKHKTTFQKVKNLPTLEEIKKLL